MSGTIDIVVRAFAGLQIEANALTFDPRLPAHLGEAQFQIHYRGHLIDVSLSTKRLVIHLEPSNASPVQVGVSGRYVTLGGGDQEEFLLAEHRGVGLPEQPFEEAGQLQPGRAN